MNRRTMMLLTSLTLLLFVVLLAADSVGNAQQQLTIQRTSLLRQDSTIPGYELIVNVVEIPAGISEIKHTHPGPLVGYVLEGTAILEHEGRSTAAYKPGEAFLVQAGKIHQGINTGNVSTKILAVLMVEKGKPTTSPAP
jgi:quercetin dioxygenase-like cupin family protein